MADWVPIDDPNDPRLANFPANEQQASAPQAPTIDFQPAAPASTGQDIQFQPAAAQAPAGPRGGDHRDLVTQSLLDHGVRPVAAAAILGDIQQESGFDPHNVSDHGSSFGLLQVGGPMFRQFNADQAAQGISPDDPAYVYNQAPFIIKKFAQQHPDRWDAMQNADSAPQALQIFRGTKDWGYGIAGKRYQYAQNYQQALSGVPVQQVDTYNRVEKAVPVTEVEHDVARALPVNGQRPPLPATDTLNAPPAPADQINFTPATAAQQPQDGINFTPAQDVSAQAGETRVSQIASDLLQDPNAPVAQTAPTPTGELPPQPAVQDWTSGYGVVKPLGLFQDPNESQNFLTPSQRQSVDTAGRYVQTATGEAAKAALYANPLTGIPLAIGKQFEQTRPLAEGIEEGTGKLAASQATLENVALASALGLPGISSGAAKFVSNVFAAQMASQLPDIWKAFNDAPDLKSKVAIATEGIGQLALTAAAAKHGVFGEEIGPAIPGAAGPGVDAIKTETAPGAPSVAAPGLITDMARVQPGVAATADVTRAIVDRRNELVAEAQQLGQQAEISRQMGQPVHPAVEQRIAEINQELNQPALGNVERSFPGGLPEIPETATEPTTLPTEATTPPTEATTPPTEATTPTTEPTKPGGAFGIADIRVPGAQETADISGNGQTLRRAADDDPNGFGNVDLLQNALDFGKQVYQKGMDFATWSAQMLRHLGGKIQEHLGNLWASIHMGHGYGGLGSVDPTTGRRYVLPDATRARFQPLETTSPEFALHRGRLERSSGGPVDEVVLPQVRKVGAGGQPRAGAQGSLDTADALSEIYSGKVKWFRGGYGQRVPVRGFEHNGTVFLNADMLAGRTGRPVHLILAHEIAHSLETNHPDLYNKLLEHAKSAPHGDYFRTIFRKGYEGEEGNHELVADLVADTLADPANMSRALGQRPGLFRALASVTRGAIDTTLRRAGVIKDPTASGMVRDLKGARDDVMDALKEARARRGTGEFAETPRGEPRLARDEPSKEVITGPANRYSDGKVFTGVRGQLHEEINPRGYENEIPVTGWTTNKRLFVDREEGYRVATRAKQISEYKYGKAADARGVEPDELEAQSVFDAGGFKFAPETQAPRGRSVGAEPTTGGLPSREEIGPSPGASEPRFARDEPSRLKASGRVTNVGTGPIELGLKRQALEARIEGMRQDLIRRGGMNHPELLISTRQPGGEDADPNENRHATGNERVHVDVQSIYRDKDYTRTLAKEVRQYLPKELRRADPKEQIEQAIEYFKRNKIAHYEMAIAYPWFERAMKQYEGYNIHGHNLARKYGFSIQQVLGGESALSPQTPPDESFSAVERLMRVIRNSGNTRWDASFEKAMVDNKIPVAGNVNSKDAAKRAKAIADRAEMLPQLRGKTYHELPTAILKANWARVYDEMHHERQYPVITPEGTTNALAMGKAGPIDFRWRSMGQISRGIQILEGARPSDILKTAKVSSYYNSKIAPNEITPDWTADTHDIGSSWMTSVAGKRPIINPRTGQQFVDTVNGRARKRTGEDPLITQTFGGPSNLALGHHGVSALHAEAGRRAAAELGVIPSDLQAGIWSHQQGFMSADALPEEALVKMHKVRQDVERGILNENQARAASIRIAKDALGTARTPVFARESEGRGGPAPPLHEEAGDQGQLPPGGGLGRAAAGGDGGGAAAGAPKARYALDESQKLNEDKAGGVQFGPAKSFQDLTLREKEQLARDSGIPPLSEMAKGFAIVKADSNSYNVLHNGQPAGTIVKGFSRLGGEGWTIGGSGKSHKTLADVTRVIADRVRQDLIKQAYQSPSAGRAEVLADPKARTVELRVPGFRPSASDYPESKATGEGAAVPDVMPKWKDASERGHGRRLQTEDGLYEIRIGDVGMWRGHTGVNKSLGWMIGKRNELGNYEDTGGAYGSLADAKKFAAERAKEYGYDHVGYTVKERNAMSAAERGNEAQPDVVSTLPPGEAGSGARFARDEPQPKTGPVTITGYHGTRTDVSQASKFGGVHIGSEIAANQRLENTPSQRVGGVPGAEKVQQVETTLRKPYGTKENPISETELATILNLPERLQALKGQGYDGIIYRNIVEDAGNISAVAFDPKRVSKVSDMRPGGTAGPMLVRGNATVAGPRFALDEPPTQAELEDASASNDRQKMRGHIATIQRMTEVSPDVKSQVESWYTPTTRDAVNKTANDTINSVGMGKATDAFMRSTKADAATMALGHNLALRLDQQQQYEDAAMVRDKMAEKLTTPAQSLWYISTIGKTSPEGLIRTAQKLMTDMIKPEDRPLLDQINRLRAEISNLKDKGAKDAATRIVIKQLAQVNKPGQRLTAGQLDNLLQKHATGDLDENQLAQTLTKYFKIPRLTPENIGKIKAAQKAWADVPDSNPILKQVRAADMMDTVYGLVPRSFWDKVRATSVISMIMHGKLPLRIGASSALRLAGQTVVDGIQNFLPDMGNIFSGRATRTGGQVRGIIEGLADPVRAYRAGYTDAKIRGLATVPSFKEGMHALLTRAQLVNRGFTDAAAVKGGMFTFSSRFGRLMENTVGLLHNVMPLAFYDAAYRSSLYRQMRAARVAVPDADMVFNAHLDANKVISNNPTMLYKFASEIRKGLDLPTAMVTKGKYGLGTALLPFALKPASLLTEGLTWTPLGLGKATAELLRPVFNKGEPIRPKEVGDALVKAALGTGVLVGAGYQLAKIGVLTGAPDDNKDLEAMRKASGWGAYKINVSELKRRAMSWDWHTRSQTPADGDYIVNYNWLEPAAFPIAAGADLAQSETKRMVDLKRGKILPAAALSAAGAGLKSLVDSPMLQGVQQFAGAVGEGQWGRAFVGLLANVPGNFVPALVRQTSQYMDNTVRETRGTFSGPISGGILVDREASNILAQIPGLEQRYPAKYDVFGDAIQRYNYGNNSLFNVFFNPAMVSKFQTNPQLAEMQRLYEATGATKGEPRQVPATLMVNGKQVELTNEQVATYQRYVGKEASAVVTRLLASPQFAAEPMGTKQAVIANVLGAVNNAAKMDLFGQSPVTVGMGMKGPTVSKPSVMDVAALVAGRQQGLKQSVMTPGPVAPQLPPLWRVAPPPALPSRAP